MMTGDMGAVIGRWRYRVEDGVRLWHREEEQGWVKIMALTSNSHSDTNAPLGLKYSPMDMPNDTKTMTT